MRIHNALIGVTIGFAVAVSGLIVGPAVAQDDPVYERVMKDKKLRVYALQGPLPQTFRDGEEFKGFDADIFRYITKKMGVALEPVWGPPAAMVLSITSGRADISIAYYRTPEREQVIDFTTPYKWIGDHVIVNVDDNSIKNIEDLKTKTVGVVRGSTQEIAAKAMQEAGFIKDIRSFEQMDLVYQDLKVKRVDAILNQTIYHQWLQNQNPDLKAKLAFEVNPKYFGRSGLNPSQFPVPKGANKLRETVDKILIEMRENGEMERIFTAYGITDPVVWTPPK